MALHCWHNANTGFARGDGAHQVVCCHCGKTDWTSTGYRDEKPLGHGPHVPTRRVHIAEMPDAEGCTGS